MSTLHRIKKLQTQRNHLLDEVLAVETMIPGSFKEVYRKCGRKNCWCAEQGGHLLRRITWSDNGTSRSKAIPENDVEWINHTTERYREFKRKCRKLFKLDADLKVLLDTHEKETIAKTRRLRDYL
jgi:hypothetical protein